MDVGLGVMADLIGQDEAGDSFLQCGAQKVSDYVHLGSCMQASGALGVEVARRSHDAGGVSRTGKTRCWSTHVPECRWPNR